MNVFRFFFGATFFLCVFFCSTDDAKSYFHSVPEYTHADTARIDSIAAEIDGMTNLILGSSISKTFDCGDGTETGKVTVNSYKGITEVEVEHCGNDHGSTTTTATFLKGKLIYYYEQDGSWSFDMSGPYDSTKAFPTFDVTRISISYIQNDREIKKEVMNETVFNSTGVRENKNELFYFFDNSGDDLSDSEKEMQNWIRFAKSKKPYSEFFPGN